MHVFRFVGLIAICAFSMAWSQSDLHRQFVATDKNAYLIMPPEFVCGPRAMIVKWSLDGEHLVVMRTSTDTSTQVARDALTETRTEPKESETQVVVWSAKAHKSTTVLSLRQSQGVIHELYWIPGSSRLLLSASLAKADDPTRFTNCLLMLPAQGPTRVLLQEEPGEVMLVDQSSYTGTIAVLQRRVVAVPATPGKAGTMAALDRAATVRFVGPDGNISAPISLDNTVGGVLWSSDGRPYAFGMVVDKETKRRHQIWYLVNRTTQKLEPSSAPPGSAINPGPEPPKASLVVTNIDAMVQGPSMHDTAPVVTVESPKVAHPERSIVTTDGSDGQISPTQTGISYNSQGSVMVRELAKVSLEAYEKYKLNVLRSVVLSQAKQVALALIMNCQDNDQKLVSNKGDWRTELTPYIKNPSLLDGFNYTFGGGQFDKTAHPADTELGYVLGPNGRAIAYMDGHVKWQPNP